MSENKKVRVRFAPSPTGALHLGGVRTALFNYLFAKHNGGDFLLRIEDTDQTRYVEGAEEYIINSLKWCGLIVDEGVGAGGSFGPYRQSERKDIYRQYAIDLVASDNAYYAFDSAAELDVLRSKCESKGETFIYNASTRKNLNNSLTKSKEATQALIDEGVPYVIRFKMRDNEEVILNDIIRGEVHFNTSTLDDKVLFKSDGMPTYHLANVVDDHLMKISHVIRGEEWLPSLPLHYLLYRSFGWLDTMPQFAHLPLILKPVGNGKLSKRDGNKMGFPVFPLEFTDPATGETWHGYREDGYFPEAFINMLALLGWNAGDDKEIYSLDELCEAFTLERVTKSGSKFDPEKAKWFNHKYLVAKSDIELASLLKELLLKRDITFDNAKLEKICSLMKERANFIADILDNGLFFFQAPTKYEEKDVKKHWKDNSSAILTELYHILENITDFSATSTEQIVSEWINSKGLSFGKVMNPFRVAIVGAAKGPHLFDITEVIGKNETLSRLKRAIEVIK
ncbi:MAG: glutamate--tRNA ligase [Culturomica sp.]|jgi:glutamyl-tRNA synthetase|nr:glutamate--tRNA ligase [Culturomica sp.]